MKYTGPPNQNAWEVSDAPVNYIELLKKSIIGIEIDITRLEGKYKMSQEMGSEDREGIVEGFKALDTEVGGKMSQTVADRGAMKDAAKAARPSSS